MDLLKLKLFCATIESQTEAISRNLTVSWSHGAKPEAKVFN